MGELAKEDKHTINLIKKGLRKLSLQHKYKNMALNQARVDAALVECAVCGAYCYTGDSAANFGKFKLKYKDKKLVQGVDVDHINPVIDPEVGFVDWNAYICNLFCDVDNYQCLCKECHKEKTAKEGKVRTKSKTKAKRASTKKRIEKALKNQ